MPTNNVGIEPKQEASQPRNMRSPREATLLASSACVDNPVAAAVITPEPLTSQAATHIPIHSHTALLSFEHT